MGEDSIDSDRRDAGLPLLREQRSSSRGERRTSTFLFYDNFDYDIDTTKWAVGGTGTRTVSNSIVKQLISGSASKETLTGITDNTGNNIVTGSKHRVDQDSGSNSAERIGIQNDYKVVFSNNGGNIKQFLNENTAWGPIFGTFNVGQWYITEMYYDGKQLQTRDDYSPTWNAWTVSGKSGHMDIWAFAYSGGTVDGGYRLCVSTSVCEDRTPTGILGKCGNFKINSNKILKLTNRINLIEKKYLYYSV